MSGQTDEAFRGRGRRHGFSEAIKVDDVMCASGTIGPDMQLRDAITDQMRSHNTNLAETLVYFGASLHDVVSPTVFVPDLDDPFARGARSWRNSAKGIPCACAKS